MKKIKLELSPKQLIGLQKMVFIGDMVINGAKTEDFDLDVESAQKAIINASVQSWNLWYIQNHTQWWYDFWVELSMELFSLLQEYVQEYMDVRILELLTQNMLKKLWKEADEYEELEERIDDFLAEHSYESIFVDLPEISNPIFQKQ